MRKLVSIPSELIDHAGTKDIDEMLRILWDYVRYKLTWEIVDKWLLELLDPNLRRSQKMMWNKNSVLHTDKQCVTDCKQSVTHCKNSVLQTVKTECNRLSPPSPKPAKPPVDDEAVAIYISNNILLYNIVYSYIHNNITYKSIAYQIEKQGEQKYIYGQMKEAERLVKKVWMDGLQTILNFISQDEFRSKQILSIAKLNKTNKDGVPYYIVMMDKIKQYTPKVIHIPTV